MRIGSHEAIDYIAAAASLRRRKDVVLMQAFDGQAPDRASRNLARALHQLAPEQRLVWAGRRDGLEDLPIEWVAWRSLAHARMHGRAFALTTTHSTLPRLGAASGRLLQLWHGVPVKSLGLDNRELSPELRDWSAQVGRKWDLVASPSEFYDRHVGAALGADPANVVRVGMPRYDFLAECVAANPRPTIPEVLYAPTARGAHDWQDSRFDELAMLRSLDRLLPPDVVLRYRPHYYLSAALPDVSPRVVLDPRTQDALDVIARSSVVVTDFSSVLVDACVLGRPVVVHAPDLETYRRSPGLNVDLAPRASAGPFHSGLAAEVALALGPDAWCLGEATRAELVDAAGCPGMDQDAASILAEHLLNGPTALSRRRAAHGDVVRRVAS